MSCWRVAPRRCGNQLVRPRTVGVEHLDIDEIVAEDGFWADLEIVNNLNHLERREFLRSFQGETSDCPITTGPHA